MYTEAIRKIFANEDVLAGTHFDEYSEIAKNAEFKLLSFNGDIYFLHKKEWIKTPLRISDFRVSE